MTEEKRCRQYGHRTENDNIAQSVQTLLWAGGRRYSFVFPAGIFLFSRTTRQVAGPILDNRGCFSGVKSDEPWNLQLPSSAGVNHAWSHTSASPRVIMKWCSVGKGLQDWNLSVYMNCAVKFEDWISLLSKSEGLGTRLHVPHITELYSITRNYLMTSQSQALRVLRDF